MNLRTLALAVVIAVLGFHRPTYAQQCRADFDGSGAVEINEVIQVVNEALGGCGVTPTIRPSATPTRTAPQATATRTERAPTGTPTPITNPDISLLIGKWTSGSTYTLIASQNPRILAGSRSNLPDVVRVYYAEDVPGIPSGTQFVLVSADVLGGQQSLVFAGRLTSRDEWAGMWTFAGFGWPQTGRAPNWDVAQPMTLRRSR